MEKRNIEQFIIDIIESCTTFEQLLNLRKWINQLIDKRILPYTGINWYERVFKDRYIKLEHQDMLPINWRKCYK